MEDYPVQSRAVYDHLKERLNRFSQLRSRFDKIIESTSIFLFVLDEFDQLFPENSPHLIKLGHVILDRARDFVSDERLQHETVLLQACHELIDRISDRFSL